MSFEPAHDNMAITEFSRVACALRLFPSKLETQINFVEEDNCAIHEPFSRGPSADGCSVVAVGTHSSIRTLYEEEKNVRCFAEVGARVIDAKLARVVFHMHDHFVIAAFNRSSSFRRRYMRGSPVGVSVYGAGYCYLRLIEPPARSRVARVLGPSPLVVDVLRMVIAVGNWTEDGFALKEVTGNMLHVDSAKVSEKSSLRAVVFRMLKKVYQNVHVCIGMDVKFDPGVLLPSTPVLVGGRAGLYDRRGYVGVIPVFPVIAPSDFLLSMWKLSTKQPRAYNLAKWFLDWDVDIDSSLLKCLMVATIAGPALPVVGGDEIRRFVRMWAVVGDTVAKYYVAVHSFCEGCTPEQYTSRLQSHSNKAMASLFNNIGLRDVSEVGYLSETSKANADIVEAIVGVIALYGNKDQLLRILRVFKLVSDDFKDPDDDIVEAGVQVDVPRLTSSQHKKFMKMYNDGVFGD